MFQLYERPRSAKHSGDSSHQHDFTVLGVVIDASVDGATIFYLVVDTAGDFGSSPQLMDGDQLDIYVDQY